MKPILRAAFIVAFFSALHAHAADAPPAKLKYGTWGFDLAGMDTKTKPGDDFFRYANGTWLDKTQIPPDKPAYSMRIIMTDFTEQRLREMLEAGGAELPENPSTLGEKAGAFFHSFLDEAPAGRPRAQTRGAGINKPKKTKNRAQFSAP